MSIQELEQAVNGLSQEDLAVFRAWFSEFDAGAWDKKFETDVAAGRLDSIANEVLRDLCEGRTIDL